MFCMNCNKMVQSMDGSTEVVIMVTNGIQDSSVAVEINVSVCPECGETCVY